jgi:hypothetical protein
VNIGQQTHSLPDPGQFWIFSLCMQRFVLLS